MKMTCRRFVSGIFAVAIVICRIQTYALPAGATQEVKCVFTELSNLEDCGRSETREEKTGGVSIKTAMPIRASWTSMASQSFFSAAQRGSCQRSLVWRLFRWDTLLLAGLSCGFSIARAYS